MLTFEQQWMKSVMTTPWEKTMRIKNDVFDQKRAKVITYITANLLEILQLVSERKFHQAIEPTTQLVLLARLLYDSKPAMHLYQMLGSLMMNAGFLHEGFRLFEVAKDLAHEAQNLSQEMVCFEWMGRAKQEMREFNTARIAFKKMLQLAWLTKLTDYEVKSYNEIAKQYFYLEETELSNNYAMKALSGDVEALESTERVISEDQYRKKVTAEGSQGKYERMGHRVIRNG